MELEGEGDEGVEDEGIRALVVLGEGGVVVVVVVVVDGAAVLVGASVRATVSSVMEAMVAVIVVGDLELGSWWHRLLCLLYVWIGV